jgi:uncharacterized membrane protein
MSTDQAPSHAPPPPAPPPTPTPPPTAAAAFAPAENERVVRVEIVISTLLRWGVRISLSVVVVGLIISFIRHPEYRHSPQSLKVLTGRDAVFPHSIDAVASGVRHGSGPSIVMLGLFLLIATPVMRVAVSILAFAFQRDVTFVLITVGVLLLLLLSFILGSHE